MYHLWCWYLRIPFEWSWSQNSQGIYWLYFDVWYPTLHWNLRNFVILSHHLFLTICPKMCFIRPFFPDSKVLVAFKTAFWGFKTENERIKKCFIFWHAMTSANMDLRSEWGDLDYCQGWQVLVDFKLYKKLLLLCCVSKFNIRIENYINVVTIWLSNYLFW